MGERDEHEHSLAEDLVSLVLRHEFYCPAVMESVCKFNEYNTYVVVKSKENSLEVLGLHALLLGLVFIIKDSLDLGESFNKSRYLISEKTSEIIDSVVRVFHYVMQKRCHYGFIPKSDIAYDDLGYSDRMKYIWFTGTSPYALVCFISKFECLLNHFQFSKVCTTFACCLLEVCIIPCNDFVVLLSKL